MKAFLNDLPVRFTEGETILEVARREGVFVPTLCEFAALHHRPGTCRMCLVEIVEKDRTRTVTACDTRMKEGLRVRTTGTQLRSMRRLQAELLFADHCERCSECPRHGDCELQTVAKTVGLDVSRLSGRYVGRHGTDATAPALTFTPDKCIRCLRCLEVCRQVQGVGAITLEGFGTGAAVGFDGAPWGASDRCIQCGQCSLVCPTGAIAVKDQGERALELFEDPAVTTVVQIAPAVRFTIGEAMGRPAGENLEGFLVAGLKKLGADLVCDTRWSADVTILEEGTELIERLEKMKRENRLDRPDTMFTSCCPGWINHVEKSAADLIDHISTTRSPQGIFGALAKTWLPKALKIKKDRIRVISIMPCTAKKDEAARPALSRGGGPDVDLVLTVRELATLFMRHGLTPETLAPAAFDSPFMTEATGAAQLFATTGGVMEAALRTVSALTGGPRTAHLAFEPVRGLKNAKEATVETDEFGKLRVAVVYGIREADRILKLVREGRSPYHFIEVMACPGGCIGGGGTNRGPAWSRTLPVRQEAVYDEDAAMAVKSSHENPDVARLYREYLGTPGSRLAHDLLHTHYGDRRSPAKTPLFRQLVVKLHAADCE